MPIAVFGAALQVDINAKAERIGAREATVADLPKKRVGFEHGAVRGTGRDDDCIKDLPLPRLTPAWTQIDGNTGFLRCARADRSGSDRKRTLRDPAFDDIIDLRRDAKAIGVPERSQMMKQLGAFLQRQRAPDLCALQAQIVKRRRGRCCRSTVCLASTF